jgi:DNA-binding HxlR family transcriptional regulator
MLYGGAMALGVDYARQDCSLARALEVVGERWTLLVLRDCFFGVRRFSDFAAHLDISRAVLSQRLAALVDEGLLARTSTGGHAVYTVTDEAVALWPAIFALSQWGEQHSTPGRPRRLFSHADCGGAVGGAGVCARCGTTPLPQDLVTRPGPGSASPALRDDAVSRALRSPRRLLEPLPTR